MNVISKDALATTGHQTYPARKLRILHVLRAPLGGLFRHVIDLTREQVTRGHAVGLVTDSSTGGARADQILNELRPLLSLGLLRLPMHRELHVSDIAIALKIAAHTRPLAVDVVHGHGSKGGAFARLQALLPNLGSPIRAYTPHGGSFNYRAGPLIEKSYMVAESALVQGTDIFLFESLYIAKQFHNRVGSTRKLIRIVPNGLSPAEFVPVQPLSDAADFLYVGELRAAKGIDTLIDAIALLTTRSYRPRLVLVGTGPDEARLTAQAEARGIAQSITFAGLLPAREAFRLGHILVVPSRAESLPYIVLEAAAAQIPMVATDVGGIGEIFGPYRDRLIPSDNPQILAATLKAVSRGSVAEKEQAAGLAAFVATRFKISDMADAVLAGYADALEARSHGEAAARTIAVPS